METVSAYWGDHPDHLAGTHLRTGWLQSAVTVRGDASDIARAASAVTASLVPEQIAANMADADLFRVSADALTDGRFELVDGVLHQWQDGELAPAKKGAELVALVRLRDAVRALVDAEADLDTPDSVLAPLRATAVEEALAGRSAGDLGDACSSAADGTNPPTDLNADADYRKHLATVLTKRAVTAAAGA